MATHDLPNPASSRPTLGVLLSARTAVVVGASDRRDVHVAGIHNVLATSTWAAGINPSRAAVLGLPCVARAEDLPDTPDVALMLVSHAHLLDRFDDLAELGVRGFVVPGLGHEAGPDGPSVAAELALRAESIGATLLGPNCMGILVPGGMSPWIGSIPPELRGGSVAAVVQSGAVGEALAALGPRVGFRCIVSLGAEASLDVADACTALAADDQTEAVGLFVESIRRPAAFRAALHKLADAGKAVVCLSVGRSPAGARASIAHTGAIISSRHAASALFREAGVLEVSAYEDFVEALEVLGTRRRPPGTRIAAVTYSGGEASLIADQADAAGAPLPDFSSSLRATLEARYPPPISPCNPLDGWVIDDTEDAYRSTFRLLAESGEYDIVLAQIDQSPYIGEIERRVALMIARALAAGCAGTAALPAIVSAQSSESIPEVEQLGRKEHIPILRGTRSAVNALVGLGRLRRPRRPGVRDGVVPLPDHLPLAGALDEWQSSLLLERYGIPFPRRIPASSPAEAAAAASEIGCPVVVKALGPAHKDIDQVALGIPSPAEAALAAERMRGPVLVAEQVPPGIELIVGMTREGDFGPILVISAGSDGAAWSRHAACSTAPVREDEARRLVDEVPAAAVLSSESRDAVASMLVALGRLAVDHDNIQQAELSPVVAGRGCRPCAVDALVVFPSSLDLAPIRSRL
jgi:acetyltransferase